jgi:hypothetical protein
MRARGWVLTFGTLAVCAGAARATVGGPELLEVLGWEPVDRKLFVAQHHRNETGYAPTIAYFDFRSATPGRAVPVQWSIRETQYARRDKALRARLRPLRPIPAVSTFIGTRVIAVDTVNVGMEALPRYRVRAQGLRYEWDGVLEVTSFRDTSVRVLSLHPIPGRKERLAIVSFVGFPHEGGYECQMPVLLPAETDTLRVEWNPFRR